MIRFPLCQHLVVRLSVSAGHKVVPAASKYPPAKPGALCCEPLKAAIGGADATPVDLSRLKAARAGR